MPRHAFPALVLGVPALLLLAPPAHAAEGFRAGAAVVDITPPKLPVIVNGGMLSRTVDKVKTPIQARALCLTDGKTTMAIVVADSCMMGRELLDEAKALATSRTGIPADRILISATHAHSAPSAMACLGTSADPDYVPFLREKLAEAVAAAQAALAPAQVGFARTEAAGFTALRRWIRRPDRIAEDPFGNPTVRANMHAGRNPDDVTGESGPEDPELSLISVQTRDGKPLAVLATFSMHYFGDQDIAADYFGLFAEGLKRKLAPDTPFVGIMAHGCSGDIWRRDYRRPDLWNEKQTIQEYADGLVGIARDALGGIAHRPDVDLAMAETRMTLDYRVPDAQRLEWARRVVAEMGDRLPKTQTEVYAREQIFLHEKQRTEIVVQALRIGEIGIATTPCETYAITGLKIKAASPLPFTTVIELANGGDGYIPPPEQHLFGGYNTWAARSAGLEPLAEPKITQAALHLLEAVSGQPRRTPDLPLGPASQAILSARPAAWWRLHDFAGPLALDASGHHRHATYESRVTFYLDGPASEAFCGSGGGTNRAAMFVGGRLVAQAPELSGDATVSLWVWNGMPTESRDPSGWFYSRDHDHGLSAHGEHLGVSGSGHLIYQPGPDSASRVTGKTLLPRWEWRHVAWVRSGTTLRVYLDGNLEIETAASRSSIPTVFFGGRSDLQHGWEGRLDEIAVFPRSLDETEIRALGAR
jgi:hypothetical protein